MKEQCLAELEGVRAEPDFGDALADLMHAWHARRVGLEGVEAILRFIEAYPDLDYGTPGAVVHFAETFHRQGYEAALLRSIDRRPTTLTAWMLNRLANGTPDGPAWQAYVAAFERAAASPSVDEEAREDIDHYLSIMYRR